MKFSGIMIGSDDPHALAAFYAKVLGEPGFKDENWYAWTDGAQLVIGSHSEVKGKNDLPQRLMLSFDVSDVREAFEKLKATGAPVIADPYSPQGETEALIATVADPDGNYVQISTPWNP